MFAVVTKCDPKQGDVVGRDARFMCKRDTPRDDDSGDDPMGEGGNDDPELVEKVVHGTVHGQHLGILEDGTETFDDVDADLRVLIARCMCEDPAARPTLVELEAEITRRLAAATRAEEGPQRWDEDGKPIPGAGPAYLEQFVQRFFHDAPSLPNDKETWLPSHTPRERTPYDFENPKSIRAVMIDLLNDSVQW